MDWLLSHGCLLSTNALTAAVEAGRWDALHWLIANRCPWNVSATEGAASTGRMDFLQWLHQEGCPWNEHAAEYASFYFVRSVLIAPPGPLRQTATSPCSSTSSRRAARSPRLSAPMPPPLARSIFFSGRASRFVSFSYPSHVPSNEHVGLPLGLLGLRQGRQPGRQRLAAVR